MITDFTSSEYKQLKADADRAIFKATANMANAARAAVKLAYLETLPYDAIDHEQEFALRDRVLKVFSPDQMDDMTGYFFLAIIHGDYEPAEYFKSLYGTWNLENWLTRCGYKLDVVAHLSETFHNEAGDEIGRIDRHRMKLKHAA